MKHLTPPPYNTVEIGTRAHSLYDSQIEYVKDNILSIKYG